MALEMIEIAVVYATTTVQRVLNFSVPATTTVATAIEQSGIRQLFPEIDLTEQAVGIFSKLVPLSTPVQAGDRIEIYRKLLLDPKQLRRLRALRATAMK